MPIDLEAYRARETQHQALHAVEGSLRESCLPEGCDPLGGDIPTLIGEVERLLGLFTRGELVDLPRWTPVTERLPEVGASVNVACISGYVGEASRKPDWQWADGQYVAADNPITHWQPLPEPPLTREERARRTTAALDDIMAAGPHKPLPEPPK